MTIMFWDMSLGATSWNWSFGDGGNSSTQNPVYTYTSNAGSPYTVTQTVYGPGGSSNSVRTITVTTPHSISGTLSNVSGFKISGVTVTLSGTISRTAQTDSNGNYVFANLTGGGNYTINVAKPRYTFSPSSATVSNLNGVQVRNFTGKLLDTLSDFDGDAKTDISIFRPSTGYWWTLNSSNNNISTTSFGLSSDIITPRDFDGDGKTDIAVWRPSNGAWYILKSSDSSVKIYTFGVDGDIPVAGDYDGDDKADYAVFRPSNSNWYILRSSTSQYYGYQYGYRRINLCRGDYDSDGKTDVAIYRPDTSTWYIDKSSDSTTVSETFGENGDKPIPSDYDGDGKTDLATYRPDNKLGCIKRSSDSVIT